MGTKIFFGRIIHSKALKTLEVLPRAALGVDGKGCICFVDSSITTPEAAREKYSSTGFADAECITLKPLQFLLPGLIDTHLHAPQWPNLAIGMEGDLIEWVETYTDPIEASYRDTRKAGQVYSELVQKELELGTTTVAYNSTIHAEATNLLADMCVKYGQRAIVGKMCCLINSTHGNWEDSVEQSIEESKKSIEYMRSRDPDNSLITPCVMPRGGRFCPPDAMARLGEQSHEYKDDSGRPLPVQAHMSEAPAEIKSAFQVHPNFQHYTELYNAYGLLHSRSILAHCIHLTDRDFDLLAETKAGVAHNPNSNTCLRDGECRVRRLLDRGIKVGLGSDCSAGYSTSMLDAMRSASNVSRHLVMHTGNEEWKLAFEELIYLATMGGAEVLGMEDRIGNFEIGKCFDALRVDVSEGMINYAGWEADDLALVKKWVFMGDDRSIRQVYVNGELVSGKDK